MKKYLILLAVMLMGAAVLFTGCSSDDDERRTLVMGTSADFPPFEFVADDGQGVIGRYAGIDVSLVARIAEELDMDIVIQDQPFIGLIMALTNRDIDFIASGMTIRPDRAEQVNFTIPYFDARQTIIVNIDNDTIHSVADFEGLRVGVQFGTTAELSLNDDMIITGYDLISYNQPTAGIIDLLNGSIDVFVVDSPVARGFLANHPDQLRIFTDEEFFGPEQFGMAFHLEDTELLGMFNEVLERLIAEGFVDYLYTHYTTMLALE
ncbi:MAG: transporter substrate-binding domain-containing protein [Defluviitaleaceae bacterium]|nr:transporter substrate-binding domain-containing protein [Defluviitaleaceae bacterium]